MLGYAGRILYIDLNSKKTSVDAIESGFCEKYIGGNGFSIRLLYENTKPGIDAFDQENALVFTVGPFAGTLAPTSGKYSVQAKSPLTGFMGEAISSGAWGPALKSAGYDAVVIKGKAEKPTYIFLDDDVVNFRDAKHLWGQDAIQTEEKLTEEIGDENACVAAIGPAGENLVRFASINNDRYRQAGRTGMGAVMGSKNLKAIAVRGTKTIQVQDLDKLIEVCQDLNKQLQGPGTDLHRKWGTAGMVATMNALGAFPTRNYQQAMFEMAENIAGENIVKNYGAKARACSGCPIACDHVGFVEEGPYAGTYASVEYETLYSLGSECGISSYATVAKANDLCDRLGMDTMSAGVTIGWAMEAYEKGILSKEDTGGIDLTFGNDAALIEVLKKIAYRDGVGNLLAEGSKKASQKIGKGSEHFAMHNKGLEYSGYDLRGLKACALGFNTSTRGGCHLRSQMYDYDTKGKVDRFKGDRSYGKLTMDREDLLAIVDSLILCKFVRGIFYTYDKFAEIYGLTTGINMTPEKMREAGERIYTLEKAYNIREGWQRKDDYPAPRIMSDPIPEGPAKGSFVSKEEFELMLDAYFEARGWTYEGLIPKQKLIDLGLNDVANDVGV